MRAARRKRDPPFEVRKHRRPVRARQHHPSNLTDLVWATHVMKSPSGYPVQSPYLSIATRQVDTMLRIATEFGFTPARRGQRSMIARGDANLLESEELDNELKELGELKELRELKW